MPSVLLAEDDEMIRRIATVALERAGFAVTAVGDGVEALQLLEGEVVDVVILDGIMPKMDGLDVCRRLKASPRTAHVPVVILSARSQAVDEVAARLAGADGYIRKPFDALRLGDMIRLIVCSVAA